VLSSAALGGTGVVAVKVLAAGAGVVAAGRGRLAPLLIGEMAACGLGLRVVRLELPGLLFLGGSLVLGLQQKRRS